MKDNTQVLKFQNIKEKQINTLRNIEDVQLVHEFFEYFVDRTPKKTAVIFKNEILTYEQVETLANQMAHYIYNQGIKPKQMIALYLNRSYKSVITILAILKSGCGYIPLDPSYPQERIQHIINDSNAQILISENELSGVITDISGCSIINYDKIEMHLHEYSSVRITRRKHGVTPDNLCYIIYTSGTTGKPKGIMTEHCNAVSFTLAFRKNTCLTSRDRIFHGFSLSFDGSVEEIGMAFVNGATLVVSPQDLSKLASETANYINKNNVTVFSTIPTFLSMIKEEMPYLRLIILSGEQCPHELVDEWANKNRRLLNVYGPTETTVNATVKECKPGQPVTIGKAIEGYKLYIIDENKKIVDKGKEGELYIGGSGLARGYLNLESLTKSTFIENLLNNKDSRLYKTGDLVKENENCELIFLGRIDTQVKVRGYRIELLEIEKILLEHECIESAVVTVSQHRQTPELVAYIITSGSSVNQDEILKLLKNRLPAYMIPNYLEVIDEFPRLTSGKIDRKNLPRPQNPLIAMDRTIVKPRTAIEKNLVKIWQKIFEIEEVSIEDDFFIDLGGYSLTAAKVVTTIRDEPEISANIDIRDIYSDPTISKLAKLIKNRQYLNKITNNNILKNEQEKKKQTSKEVFNLLSKRFYPVCVFLQLFCSAVFITLGAVAVSLAILFSIEIAKGTIPLKTAIIIFVTLIILIFPVSFTVSILSKWIIIGRYKPGKYPLWSFYYFRCWVVGKFIGMSGMGVFAGTPIINLYYRLLGVKIGKNCIIDTTLISSFDLITIGDNTCICSETQIPGSRIEDGMMVFGTVEIGSDCFIGIHSSIGLNVKMENGSKLGDLSCLPDNQTLKTNTAYAGSPAEQAEIILPEKDKNPAKRHPVLWSIIFFFMPSLFALFFIFIIIPELALAIAAFLLGGVPYLIASLFIDLPLGIILYCLGIAIVKKILLRRVKPGTYSVESFFYLRKWYVDGLIKSSVSAMKPLYTTIYLPTWLRMLGAKIGKRAEISTVSQITPELMELGDESFFADGSIIGGRHYYDGKVQIARSKIGKRSFIGNSAIMPIGKEVGDNCLIGAMSTPPLQSSRVQDCTEWLGSIPFRLPFRQKVGGFSKEETFQPTVKLYIQRLLIDAFRILLPGLIGLISALALAGAMYLTYINYGPLYFALISPIYTCLSGIMAVLTVVLCKWIIMGKFKPEIKPLWCLYIWFNEALNGAYESLAAPILSNFLGTPIFPLYLRLLGCKIGKRVYIGTTLFSEFDLVKIGDYAALNAGVVVQNHLFEDRIFKSSYLNIGESCSLGNMAVILYDTEMKEGSNISSLSLLMKGEILPEKTNWYGIPTRRM